MRLAADRRQWRLLWILAIPAGAYVAWLLLVGRSAGSAAGIPPGVLTPLGLGSVVAFVAVGISSAWGGLFGIFHILLSWPSEVLLTAALALLIGSAWYRRRRVDPLALGALAGLLAQYLLTGLVRVQLGADEAGARRYSYVAATFVLVLVGDALRGVDWRPLPRRGLVIAMLVIALVSNATILAFSASRRVALSDFQEAELQTVAAVRGAPGLSLDSKVDPVVTDNVTPRGYYTAVDRLGSPVPPSTFSDLTRLPARPVDQALSNMFGPSLQVVQPPEGFTASGALACGDIPLSSTSEFNITVPAGGRVVMVGKGPASPVIFLWYRSLDALHAMVTLDSHATNLVIVPDTGHPLNWQMGMVGTGTVSTCVYPP